MTAEITILRYAVVHDCGNLINPMIVEGQIHGGVAQGVGGALYERMVYDDARAAAQRLVHGLPDALRHRGPDTIEIDHLETPSPLNPLGIKGAGEAGVIPVRRGHRRRHRGRRGLPHHARCRSRRPSCASCACSTPPTPSPPEETRMKFTGELVPGRRPSTQVWAALLDPAVLVAHDPRAASGCEATGENAYAMTVTAGVAAIKGTYTGEVRPHRPGPARVADACELSGAGAPGHHRRRRPGPASQPSASAAPTSPTTPTRSSAG